MLSPGAVSSPEQGLKNRVGISFVEGIHPTVPQSGWIHCVQISESIHGWCGEIEDHSTTRLFLLHQTVGTEQH